MHVTQKRANCKKVTYKGGDMVIIYSRTTTIQVKSSEFVTVYFLQCFDLNEKERYKRLLQQFTDLPSNRQSLARLSTRPALSTITEQPL